jgi:hypothetical protein
MEEFVLVDHLGVEHQYKMTLHSPKSGGLNIIKDLTPIFVAVASAVNGKEVDMATAISQIEGLIERMVMLVHRDGKPLRDAKVFDEAFMGNYQELYTLLAKVVEVNRFLGAMSSSLSGMLAG